MKKTYKFELPQNKELKSANTRVEDGKLFVDVEFQEKFDPKDGDFLYCEKCGVFICRSNSPYEGTLRAYVGIGSRGQIVEQPELFVSETYWCWINHCRYATPEEKSAFLERLEKECHKKWNPEKKCLEDIYIPKFGDIVHLELKDNDLYASKGTIISIYPNKEMTTDLNGFFDIFNLGHYGEIINKVGANVKSIRLASELEKNKLFNKLAEVGKRWNEETKQLEDIRWRAGQLCEYYSIDFNYTIKRYVESFSIEDFKRYTNGNYFRTPEAAQKVADQIKDIFKKSKVE